MATQSKALIDDLKWRGLFSQSTDEAALIQALSKPTTLYIGFDPTAPSLHVGNLVVLLALRRFQLAGHIPIALVGGATGLIGDPSGKNEERSLNTTDVVAAWVERIRVQVSKYLDFNAKDNAAIVANNLDWTSPLSAIEFLRDVGKHFSVNQMLAKADGSKFGKTAGGAIWLDPEMTSPYAFFQYWLNTDDKDVINFLKVFSFKSREEIEALEKSHSENPGAREAHRALARELTSLVHSAEICDRVEAAARALFGQGELSELDEATLTAALAELPRTTVKSGEPIPTWVDLLAATGVVDSKSAARRIVKEGGAYLNNAKISGEDFAPSKSDFLCGKYAVLRKGKRDLAAVELL